MANLDLETGSMTGKLTVWGVLGGILRRVLIYLRVQMGDRWWAEEHPCMSFSCSEEGIQMVTKICPAEHCQEVLNISTAATQYLRSD